MNKEHFNMSDYPLQSIWLVLTTTKETEVLNLDLRKNRTLRNVTHSQPSVNFNVRGRTTEKNQNSGCFLKYQCAAALLELA